MLFAIGLGAIGIGGAVAIHLSLSLIKFVAEQEETSKALETIRESVLTLVEAGEKFEEKFSEFEKKIEMSEKKMEEISVGLVKTCYKVSVRRSPSGQCYNDEWFYNRKLRPQSRRIVYLLESTTRE